eukprot:c21711_g1_i1.p1 GENE.c21711_g1_i1~~c21711_g1_i1.p1  ORF type:complete len:1135 (-),score=265.47 c21711_g1_i1:29-3433(-)
MFLIKNKNICFIFITIVLILSINGIEYCPEVENNQSLLLSEEVIQFCHNILPRSRSISPVTNISCARENDPRFIILKKAVGCVNKQCGFAITKLICLSFFPTVESSQLNVSLPCIREEQNQGHPITNSVTNWMISQCAGQDSVLDFDHIRAVSSPVDNILATFPDLVQTCQPIDIKIENWKPRAFSCPVDFVPDSYEIVDAWLARSTVKIEEVATPCSLICPSPFLSSTQWLAAKGFTALLNIISLLTTLICIVLWTRNADKNKYPASMIRHLLIALFLFHLSTLWPIAVIPFRNEPDQIMCENKLPSKSSHELCFIQGGFIILGVKLFVSWWLCIVINLYLTLVRDMRSTKHLQKYYVFIGYIFPCIVVVIEILYANINYTQGRTSCFINLGAGGLLLSHEMIFLDIGVLLTVLIVRHVVKLQKKFGIWMQKPKIFCIKLVFIALVLSTSIVHAYSVFSSDPGWTYLDYSRGYTEWKICRFAEYLSSEYNNTTPDYSKCIRFQRLKFSMTIVQVVFTGVAGAVSSIILILPSDFIIKVSEKLSLKNHTKSKVNGGGSSKQSGGVVGNSNKRSASNSESNNEVDHLQKELVPQNRETRTLSITASNSTPASPQTPMARVLRNIINQSPVISPLLLKRDISSRPEKKRELLLQSNNGNGHGHSGAIAVWADLVPLSVNFDYIIIGGGVAAGYAAREFVNQGIETGRVALFSSEPTPPYERPYLTRELLNCQANFIPKIFTCATGEQKTEQTADWYTLKGISLFLKTKIVHFDPTGLAIKDSQGMVYKALKGIIIATGASPFQLPVTNIIQAQEDDNHFVSSEQGTKPYKKLFYLRSINDATKLSDQLRNNKKEHKINTCLIIGAGFIGLECVSAALMSGWRVILVSKSNCLVSSIFSPQVSILFEKYLSDRGVQVLTGSGCSTLLSDCGSVVGCRLENGVIVRGDITVVGVGVTPNTEIFKNKVQFQSFQRSSPILVDENFKTSCSGVYAIGDVASPLFSSYGVNQLEHAENARLAGAFVVKYLLSDDADKQIGSAFVYHPSVSSFIIDINWNFFGDNTGPVIKIFGDLQTRLLVLWLWQGRIQGALIANGENHHLEFLSNATKEQMPVPLKDLKDLTSFDSVYSVLITNWPYRG